MSRIGVGPSGLKNKERRRYERYTKDQLDVLEKFYLECPNPSQSEQLLIIQNHPRLRSTPLKQLKVWFQNRRCRDKKRTENDCLLEENKRLIATNKCLKEQNDDLQKKILLVMTENEHLQNKLVVNSSHRPEAHIPSIPQNNMSVVLLAEETRNEFLSKATGNAINWTQAQGLKLHSLGLIATFDVSLPCTGVAARACATIPFEPVKAHDILKDRPSWSWHCRNMIVVDILVMENGGTVEFVHTQYYAPTIMACGRDFWTLRYTSVLGDGSIVICEQSITDCDGAPSSPLALELTRGKKLASGYLIQPVEEGSTLYMVEHLDLEASFVPELIRSLYESPELVAKHMIIPALQYVQLLANGTDDNLCVCLSNKLNRGFNDAINGLHDDGWRVVPPDASESDGVITTIRTARSSEGSKFDAVICVKAALLLQNIFPANVVHGLEKQCADWMDFNYSNDVFESSQSVCTAFPSKISHNLLEDSVPLGYTHNKDETLEVKRFRRITDCLDTVYFGDIIHLKAISGMEDRGFEDCTELICAPIDQSLDDQTSLLSYGFRIIRLGGNARQASELPPLLLILAFQFPVEVYAQESAIVMARNHAQRVLSIVRSISAEITPSPLSAETAFAAYLASLMRESFRKFLGIDLMVARPVGSLLEQIQNHFYAILCFSVSTIPVCLYANNMALTMLETTPDNLQMVMVDRILSLSDDDGESLRSITPTVLQNGYVVLPQGYGLTAKSNPLSYEQAMVWKVEAHDKSIPCMAMALTNWRHFVA